MDELSRFPSPARLLRGRAAVTACPGQDKCGMCEAACGFGAIKKPGRVPEIDHEKCVGCGACVKACPRMNMRLADGSKGEDICEVTVKCPAADLPETDAPVLLFGAGGAVIGRGRAVQAYPLPDGRHGLIRFRADRALIASAVRAAAVKE